MPVLEPLVNRRQPPTAAGPQAPAAPVAAGRPLLAVGLVISLLASALVTALAPGFAQMYGALGADPPDATRLVLAGYPGMWALPVAVLLAWYRWPKAEHRPLAACLLGVLGSILLVPLVLVTLYLPLVGGSATG